MYIRSDTFSKTIWLDFQRRQIICKMTLISRDYSCLNVHILSLACVCHANFYCIVLNFSLSGRKYSNFRLYQCISIVLNLIQRNAKMPGVLYFNMLCKMPTVAAISWGWHLVYIFLLCAMVSCMCSHEHLNFWQRGGTRWAIYHLKIVPHCGKFWTLWHLLWNFLWTLSKRLFPCYRLSLQTLPCNSSRF